MNKEISPKNGANTFVSVIIPVYNDRERLAHCLGALNQQTYPHGQFEVVVVDNGSDESLEGMVASFPIARLVLEQKRSSFAARNSGIEAARGDILAFTDSDCIPFPDWIENGVRQLMSMPNQGVVSGCVEVFSKIPEKPTVYESYDMIFGFQQEFWAKDRKYGATANLFTHRQIIDDVGPFNANIKSTGDQEWCLRAVDHGYQLSYSQDACVKHPARASLKALVHKRLRLAGGNFDSRKSTHNQKEPFRIGKLFLRLLVPNFRSFSLVFSNQEIPSYGQKIIVFLLGVFLRVCTIYEHLRLSFGKTSRNL